MTILERGFFFFLKKKSSKNEMDKTSSLVSWFKALNSPVYSIPPLDNVICGPLLFFPRKSNSGRHHN